MSRERKGFALTQRATAVPATIVEKHGENVEQHPAFGQIMLFKTSGMKALYGSDFPHQNYVTIEIHESELHRNLSTDWPFSQRELIRINMSEAQWGSFVSSQGVGMGTQCTIDRKMTGENMRYESMPDIQLRDSTHLYVDEGKARIDDAIQNLDDLIESLTEETGGLSKAKQQAILGKLRAARNQVGPNLKFVKDQLEEHLEERVEKSKTEVMAWIDNTVRRAGLEALGVRPLEITLVDEPARPDTAGRLVYDQGDGNDAG